MPVIRSKLKPASADFRAAADCMRALVSELDARQQTVREGGDSAARERHRGRGKLLPRERIAGLLDPQTSFVELSPLAAWQVYDEVLPAAGLITGVGQVSGERCMIIANDATVKGGTYFPLTVKKHLRAQEIASENRLPCIYLVDSGGAHRRVRIPYFRTGIISADLLQPGEHVGGGRAADRVRDGSCTAGGAYVPRCRTKRSSCATRERYFSRGSARESRDREIVNAEDLGGADVHTRVSGVADHLAENDRDALDLVGAPLPISISTARLAAPAPRARPFTIRKRSTGSARSSRTPFDVREIIALSSTRASSTSQGPLRHDARLRLRPNRGPCGRHHREHGVLFSESALKARLTSSSFAASATFRLFSCRTSAASWSA